MEVYVRSLRHLLRDLLARVREHHVLLGPLQSVLVPRILFVLLVEISVGYAMSGELVTEELVSYVPGHSYVLQEHGHLESGVVLELVLLVEVLDHLQHARGYAHRILTVPPQERVQVLHGQHSGVVHL